MGAGSGQRLRVAVVYPEKDPVSAANWSGSPRGIATGLASQGVDVVPVGTPSGVDPARLPLMRARLRAGRGPAAARTSVAVQARSAAMARMLRRAGRLDGVVAMGGDRYLLGRVRLPDVPAATYDDGTLAQQWRHPWSDLRNAGYDPADVTGWFDTQSASLRAADVCCVSTSWAAAAVAGDCDIREDRVVVVGMGHRPRLGAVSAERDWSVPRFLLVGVDWQRKNGDAVVRAFVRVREHYPDATLDLVGGHPRLDVPGVVGHGLLRLDDPQAQGLLDQLFARATAFVMPSMFDPSPIAYLEAASAGLPVVATTQGGAQELLGEAALTVHPTDDDALYGAMLRLADPQTARALGAEARRRSAESSWSAVAGRVLAALGLAQHAIG
jgi:glycosyltransferase involved in cell wall biosynthesis